MSLTKTQIDSLIKRNCGISETNTTAYPIAEMTADENLAIDTAFSYIFPKGGTWQFDDTNHTKYPIIKTDLVSGKRDYVFTTDEQGNVILDIYKVMVKDPSGVYKEMTPRDQQSSDDFGNFVTGFVDGQDETGTPTECDKTANGIFLNKIPNYNSDDGLLIYINREGSYFTTSDTTKKPGFSGLFHEYIALEPSVRYCKRNKMFDLADRYERDLAKLTAKMEEHYGKRERDIVRRMNPRVENNR